MQAEATSLVAIVIVALAGGWRQYRYGNVRLRDAIVVGVLSPLGVAVGVVVSNTVSENALRVGFAALCIGIAVQLTRRALRPRHRRLSPRTRAGRRRPLSLGPRAGRARARP